MTSVRELHDEAMRLAQMAVVARHQGRYADAEKLARQGLARSAPGSWQSDGSDILSIGHSTYRTGICSLCRSKCCDGN